MGNLPSACASSRDQDGGAVLLPNVAELSPCVRGVSALGISHPREEGVYPMNEVIERLEELCEQGEMVCRVLWPVPQEEGRFVCLLGGPFGFEERFSFEAESFETARELCAEAGQWLCDRFLVLRPQSEDLLPMISGETNMDEGDFASRELMDAEHR
jgi:hypothetical protein